MDLPEAGLKGEKEERKNELLSSDDVEFKICQTIKEESPGRLIMQILGSIMIFL